MPTETTTKPPAAPIPPKPQPRFALAAWVVSLGPGAFAACLVGLLATSAGARAEPAWDCRTAQNGYVTCWDPASIARGTITDEDGTTHIGFGVTQLYRSPMAETAPRSRPLTYQVLVDCASRQTKAGVGEWEETNPATLQGSLVAAYCAK